MLSQLSVKNFALIDRVSLDFSGKLIVLTGETGAGKSILIDALRFVLGERLDSLRLDPQDSKSETSVEALFDLDPKWLKQKDVFQDFLQTSEDQLILRREVRPDGRSKCWINDHSVTTTKLKEIGTSLVDFHGQYDHQQLLDPESQRGMLDRYAGISDILSQYESEFAKYHQMKKDREAIEERKRHRNREMDLLKYQIDEIDRIQLQDGEEEELRASLARLVNAEKLSEHCALMLENLENGDGSASEKIQEAARSLTKLARLDSSAEEKLKEMEDLQYKLETLIQYFQTYRENLDGDSSRLIEIQERLDQIALLKKKYGNTYSEIQEFFAASKKRFEELANAESDALDLDHQMAKVLPQIQKLAGLIRAARKKAATELRKKIEEELKDLNLPHARFDCSFTETELTLAGSEKVEFVVSLNAGQEPKALKNLVSAGEVSRVMLAFKKQLAKVDSVPVLIFDEIDANIGGRLGKSVGEKLKDIAKERQVLLITHLPQIASFGDRHFKASKAVKSGITHALYREIQGEERVQELSQMMSGKEASEIARRHAQEMLEKISG